VRLVVRLRLLAPHKGDLGWGERLDLVDEVAEGALQGRSFGSAGGGERAGVLVAQGAEAGARLVSIVRHRRRPPAHQVRLCADGNTRARQEDAPAVMEVLFAAYESAGTGRKETLPFRTKAAKPFDLWKR
jgi:hypothetical protein